MLYIEIKIPTILREQYTVFKLHKLPVFTPFGLQTIATTVKTTHDYWAINMAGNKSFYLSEIEVADIESCGDKTTISTSPIISLRNNCEKSLYLHSKTSCPTEEKISTQNGISRTSSGIIFSLNKEEKAQISCSNFTQEKILSKLGVLNLPASCYVKINETIYRSTDKLASLVIRDATLILHNLEQFSSTRYPPTTTTELPKTEKITFQHANMPYIILIGVILLTTLLSNVLLWVHQNKLKKKTIKYSQIHTPLSDIVSPNSADQKQ